MPIMDFSFPVAPSGFKNAGAVAPNDSADLSPPARALYVGNAGNVNLDTVGGETNVSLFATAGATINLQVKRVRATGTDATRILALW
jgi:hypothetical protein